MARAMGAGRPLTILDMMTLALASALPMAAVALVDDDPTWGLGRLDVRGTTLVLVLLLAGLGIWGIAEAAARAGTGWLSLAALASMAGAGVAFLGVAVVVFTLNPYAAVLTLGSQMVMVFYVAFRP